MAMLRFLGATSVTSRPSMWMLPEVTLSNPAIMRKAVVLPQPEGPSRTMNSPGSTASDSSCTTVRGPKFFEMRSRSTVTAASSLDRAQQQALGDIFLERNGEGDHRRDHDDDQHRHVPPLRTAGGVLGRHEQRDGLGTHRGEEQREQVLIPGEDQHQQARGDEPRLRQRQNDAYEDAKARGAIE